MKKMVFILWMLVLTITSASSNSNIKTALRVNSLHVTKNTLNIKNIMDYLFTTNFKNFYINIWKDNIITNKLANGVVTQNLNACGANVGGNYNDFFINLGYQYEKIESYYNSKLYSNNISIFSILSGKNFNNLYINIGGSFGNRKKTNIYVVKVLYLLNTKYNIEILPSIWIEKNDKNMGNGKTDNKININSALSLKYKINKTILIVGGKIGWEKAYINNYIKIYPFYEEGNNGFINLGYKFNSKFNVNVGIKIGKINAMIKRTGGDKTEIATTAGVKISYIF